MNAPLPPKSEHAHTPVAGLFLRIFWMILGLIVLLGITAGLWTSSSDDVLWWSLSYWLNVGLILAARYVDIRHYQGETVDLEPADLGHWRRHAVILVPSTLALWIAAVLAGGG